MVKQCDKGAGVIILNYQDYIKAGEEHLKQTINDDTRNQKHLYKKISDASFIEAKTKLQSLLMSGFENEIISKEELESMSLKAKQCPSSIAISKSTRTMIISPL